MEFTTETHLTAESLGPKKVAGGDGGAKDGGDFGLPWRHSISIAAVGAIDLICQAEMDIYEIKMSCILTPIYIYIYERERERERDIG